VGGALVLCAALWWYESTRYKKLDADIATAEQRQRELQAIKVQVDALEAKRRTFQQKVDLIERLKPRSRAPSSAGRDLEEPSRLVWLTSLDQAGPIIKLSGQSNGYTSSPTSSARCSAAGISRSWISSPARRTTTS